MGIKEPQLLGTSVSHTSCLCKATMARLGSLLLCARNDSVPHCSQAVGALIPQRALAGRPLVPPYLTPPLAFPVSRMTYGNRIGRWRGSITNSTCPPTGHGRGRSAFFPSIKNKKKN